MMGQYNWRAHTAWCQVWIKFINSKQQQCMWDFTAVWQIVADQVSDPRSRKRRMELPVPVNEREPYIKFLKNLFCFLYPFRMWSDMTMMIFHAFVCPWLKNKRETTPDGQTDGSINRAAQSRTRQKQTAQRRRGVLFLSLLFGALARASLIITPGAWRGWIF